MSRPTIACVEANNDLTTAIIAKIAQVLGLKLELKWPCAKLTDSEELVDGDRRAAWDEAVVDWRAERKSTDAGHDAQALESVATLASVTKAGEALAEHPAGDLSAADWYGRRSSSAEPPSGSGRVLWLRSSLPGAVGFHRQ